MFADVKLVKVPGHCGVSENERADQLATSAIRQGGG
jgi:ribonuclease HI